MKFQYSTWYETRFLSDQFIACHVIIISHQIYPGISDKTAGKLTNEKLTDLNCSGDKSSVLLK